MMLDTLYTCRVKPGRRMDLSLESREQCLLMLSAFNKLRALWRFRDLPTMWPEGVSCSWLPDLPASSKPSTSCTRPRVKPGLVGLGVCERQCRLRQVLAQYKWLAYHQSLFWICMCGWKLKGGLTCLYKAILWEIKQTEKSPTAGHSKLGEGKLHHWWNP